MYASKGSLKEKPRLSLSNRVWVTGQTASTRPHHLEVFLVFSETYGRLGEDNLQPAVGGKARWRPQKHTTVRGDDTLTEKHTTSRTTLFTATASPDQRLSLICYFQRDLASTLSTRQSDLPCKNPLRFFQNWTPEQIIKSAMASDILCSPIIRGYHAKHTITSGRLPTDPCSYVLLSGTCMALSILDHSLRWPGASYRLGWGQARGLWSSPPTCETTAGTSPPPCSSRHLCV